MNDFNMIEWLGQQSHLSITNHTNKDGKRTVIHCYNVVVSAPTIRQAIKDVMSLQSRPVAKEGEK